MMDSLIPLFVIIPLGIAFLIPLVWKIIPSLFKYLPATGLLFLLVIAFYMLINSGSETLVYKVGGWEPVKNIPIGIHLVVDGLAMSMLVIINMIGFLACLYAVPYMKKFTGENYFFILFSLMVAGMNGVVITGDLFNLFVFLELSVISSYALVAFGSSKDELEASFKYQVLGGIASLLILFALALTYWYTSTLNIDDISKVMKLAPAGKVTVFIQLFFIAGFGLKGALIPFHAWLPDAHSSAPSPISAMLSGVLIKAIGIYALLRLFFNMFQLSTEVSIIITTIGVISMVLGVILAIGQWDMKRLFAYHSISQMGYVVMAAGISMVILSRGGDRNVAILSLTGGLFHMFNHSVFKGLLFLNAGAVEYSTGTRNLKELGGLSEILPITSATSLGASLSISGIPPFNGFFSKLIIIIAAIQGRFYFLALLAVLVSIITLASFMKVQRYAFLDKLKKTRFLNLKEVPFLMCLPMVILALLCFVMSLMIIPGIREIFLMPAVNSLISLIT
ncbi:MAG TPA: proton-conducting transporter membrane subunit [Bacteroidales bacterium]|nr:proton-conducting transporter membrane subunit [Bacteroidales bacterium]